MGEGVKLLRASVLAHDVVVLYSEHVPVGLVQQKDAEADVGLQRESLLQRLLRM